ncbi:NUDIX domain-containing protein [Roseococcus sp. YIM B11640]|uniref:NUDIX domain-containing protein n=1 Tax=Roseococcus sp. YIM B11640 TaxID=3133973 RepID=UPI003C7A5045
MSARPPKAPPISPFPGLEIRADEVVWPGRFPVQRVRFTYERFDGGRSPELTWELWRRGAGVAMLPFDPWADRVALIEQFRLPVHAAGLPPIHTECVAGLLEAGEDPQEAALRETQEEAGLAPDRVEKIGQYMLMQGGCDELMHLHCGRARLPEPETVKNHGLQHEGEDIRLLIMPTARAMAMLDANEIRNATCAMSLFWLRHHHARLRDEWTR